MSPTRRSFLGTIGGLAAGYALAPALRAAEASGKPLGLALCGLGNYSNNELSPALLETKNVKLVAAITGTHEKGVKLAKLHGFDEANIYSYE
ncbi:MAG: gfo/Idh/MocA family oxidoreductase, partial [Verrucomicrobia bacterium]|nr:gfo/Idh/MocA family oxidoreductase [Verrucomicrobiota bacterium]